MKGFLLFDAHCHAHCVAELRKAASVGAMALMSSVEKDWMSLRALCLEDNRAVFGAGIHPWFAHTVEAGWKDRLESFLLENPSAFVGEIGLDKARILAIASERVFTFQARWPLLQRLGKRNGMRKSTSLRRKCAWLQS